MKDLIKTNGHASSNDFTNKGAYTNGPEVRKSGRNINFWNVEGAYTKERNCLDIGILA